MDSDGWTHEPRNYLHFDLPIRADEARALVEDPNEVARHSFWPFIKFELETPRYRPEESEVETKVRPICYAAHADAAIYSYYTYKLRENYEDEISDFSQGVLAYRALGKSNIHFADEAFEEIKGRDECAAIALDVEGFFDNLNHHFLKEKWAEVLGCARLPDQEYQLFKTLSDFAYVKRDPLYSEFGLDVSERRRRKKRICSPKQFRQRVRGQGMINTNDGAVGIPQGSPISATLSNVYMLDFDKEMMEYADETGSYYRRYSDDILFICRRELRDDVRQEVEDALADYELELKHPKTVVAEFVRRESELRTTPDSPRRFQYLGFEFDARHKRIRPATISRYYRKMKRAVQSKLEAAKRSEGDRLLKYSLYENYSHLGTRNFITYAYRAAEIMNEPGIRDQVANHWSALNEEISKAEQELNS